MCDITSMRFQSLTTLIILCVCSGAASAQNTQKLYRWVDGTGVVHFGDSIPAEYAKIKREVVNQHGITVDVMRAKRTQEEILEEQRQEELRTKRELQQRADQAL